MKLDLRKLPQELSRLYRQNGYAPYSMSKFEEYGLYLRNKDFLISDRILTFTDTDGKLMALKPDVTLSIIKNTRPCKDAIRKVYYRENVYRPGRSMQGFREIMQIGLECMGAVDNYCIFEVLQLAVRSLQQISENCVLDVSHMGLLSAALDESGAAGEGRKQLLEAVAGKNLHEIRRICEERGWKWDMLVCLADLCGSPRQVLPKLESMFPDAQETRQLRQLFSALDAVDCGGCINVDFSVVNDMKYYNGIVFRGFVEGVPEGVLSGGQYDGLMERMHRPEKAIGFALYPDLLERLAPAAIPTEPDALLLYAPQAELASIAAGVSQLCAQGLRVNAQPDTGNRPTQGAAYILEGSEVKRLG